MELNLVDSTISNWNATGATTTGANTTSTTTDIATPTVTTKTEKTTTAKPAKNLKGIIAVAGISIVALGVAFVAFKKMKK